MVRHSEASGYYDRTARLYDGMMRVSSWLDHVDESSERSRLVSLLGLQPGQSVLVVAVGTGRDMPWVACEVGPGGRLWGIDLSRPMLDECRRGVERAGIPARLAQADAAHLPIASGAFDAALLFGGLNGFREQREALHEIVRATRPGGRIVISDRFLGPNRSPSLRSRVMSRMRREPMLPPPVSLIPVPTENIHLNWIWAGMFYVLSIEKP